MRKLLAILLLSVPALPQSLVVPATNVTGVVVGPGYVKSVNRQIVRTAANVVYIAQVDDSPCRAISSPTSGLIRMMKGSGAQALNPNVPTAFAEVDAAHHPVATGSGTCQFDANAQNTIFSPDVRMDNAGLIHMAYLKPNSQTGAATLIYQTFNTVTDMWGTATSFGAIAAACGGPFGGWPRWSNVALTLDASGNPYIIYATSYTCGTSGTNNVSWLAHTVSGGTAWTAPATISGSSGTQELYTAMTTAPDGSIHAVWLDSSLQTNSNAKWAKFSSGAWGAVETVASGILCAQDDDSNPQVAVDANGLPHVIYMVGTGTGGGANTDNFIRERYRTAGGVWTDNSPPSTSGGAPSASGTWPVGGIGHSPSLYISSLFTDFDFIGHNTTKAPAVFESQSGGVGTSWTAEIDPDPCNATTSPSGEAGCDGAVTIRYDPLRDNNKTLVDFAYYKENDGTAGYNDHGTIWYKALQIPSIAGYPTTANIWVGAAGSCTRSASLVAYNAATSCSTLQAAWNAAAATDTVIILNGIYASQSITSGTKSSAVSFYAQSPSSCYNMDPRTIAATNGGQCTASVLLGPGTATGLANQTALTIGVDHVHIYGVIANGSGESRGALSPGCPTTTSPGCTDIVVNGFAGKYFMGQGVNFNNGASSGLTVQNSEFGNFNGCTGTNYSTCQPTCTGCIAANSNAAAEDITRFWGYSFGPTNDKLINNYLHSVTTDAGGTCGPCGQNGPHVDGLQIFWSAGNSTNITVDGNVFANMGGDSNITVGGSGTESNYFIQNNYFENPGCCNSIVLQNGCAPTMSIRNNVINTSGFGLVNTNGCTAAFDVSGNIQLGSSAGGPSNGNTVTGGFNVFPAAGGSTYGPSAKRCTPTWLNGAPSAANSYDIRLSASDACAKGYDASASFAPTDFYGTTRTPPVDAGAYEFPGGGGCTTPPTASITSPGAGSVTGNTTVQSTASATCGAVASVTYTLDGSSLSGAISVAPYTFLWLTSGTSTGLHSLACNVQDTFGNSGTCAPITLQVSNPSSPTALIAILR